MNVSVEKLPKSRVKLRIEVPADDVQPYLEAAARALSKESAPKGFRPGAVPLEVMRGTVGDEPIVERALKTLVPKTYVQVLLDRDDLEAVGTPEVEVESVAIGAPCVYRATVAVLPEVTLGNYRTVRGERHSVSVDDKEVERELEQLRKLRASYLAVPRPAKLGDRVDAEVRATVEGVSLEEGNSAPQSFLLGEETLVPGFEEQLVGMRVEESKTFPLRFPETHHRADLRGRTVEFRVTVRSVQQRVLSELTDQFAQGLGEFTGLADLRSQLTAHVQEEKEAVERERFHAALLDAVIAQTRFEDVPDVLVERELDRCVRELEEGVRAMGLDVSVYLQQVRKTNVELREGLRAQALRRLRAGLTLRALARAEGLDVTDEEVNADVNEALGQLPNAADAKVRVDLDELREVAAGTIRNRKVFTLLEGLADRNGA